MHATDTEARARLNAAAPLLLEALRSVIQGSRYFGNGVWDTVRTPTDAELTAAADAIAAATSTGAAS